MMPSWPRAGDLEEFKLEIQVGQTASPTEILQVSRNLRWHRSSSVRVTSRSLQRWGYSSAPDCQRQLQHCPVVGPVLVMVQCLRVRLVRVTSNAGGSKLPVNLSESGNHAMIDSARTRSAPNLALRRGFQRPGPGRGTSPGRAGRTRKTLENTAHD